MQNPRLDEAQTGINIARSIWQIDGNTMEVRTGHGTIDWFQIGKGVREGCVLSPCLFNSYSEYIMRSAGLEEA